MKKHRPVGTRRIGSGPATQKTVLKRQRSPSSDLLSYAGAFHRAAKAMVESFRPDANAPGDFAACPVVFLYRHALELHLKEIVLGGGGNFLATKPDHLSVMKTHSVSWLAQFVCQIMTALKWEREFQCEGVASLADFKALVEQVSAVDPGFYTFRLPTGTGPASLRAFARRMDALLELLASTADALRAESDLRWGAAADGDLNGGSFGPTIQ